MLNIINPPRKKLRGVNLGGWLVLEKWMTPSLFQGLQAEDETSWCLEMGAKAEQVLTQHWQNFITRQDFLWLTSIGINAVRIPVGHWLFGADYPYHPSYADNRHPYVIGGIHILDNAMQWAEECNLQVILDLHAAPGCQNGFDNGGIKDICDWSKQPEYLAHSLAVLEKLAERYQHNPFLRGIEVLNEPRWDIDTQLLTDYTVQACQRIRQYCPAEKVAVVFHDGFRSYTEYTEFLQTSQLENLLFDIHRYQCFVEADVEADIYEHINKAVTEWKQEADQVIAGLCCKTIVGEWSLGLNPRFLEQWAQQPADQPGQNMDDFQQALAWRAYATAQLLSFEKYQGWFFWSYKTEDMPQWSFKHCVGQGWLPASYFDVAP